jgi:hypothetical protein
VLDRRHADRGGLGYRDIAHHPLAVLRLASMTALHVVEDVDDEIAVGRGVRLQRHALLRLKDHFEIALAGEECVQVGRDERA